MTTKYYDLINLLVTRSYLTLTEMKIFIFWLFLKQPFLICVLTIKTVMNYFIVGLHKNKEYCYAISRFRNKCILGNVFKSAHDSLWLAYNPPRFGRTVWYFCITVHSNLCLILPPTFDSSVNDESDVGETHVTLLKALYLLIRFWKCSEKSLHELCNLFGR